MINSFQWRVNLIFNSNKLSEINGLIDYEFPYKLEETFKHNK